MKEKVYFGYFDVGYKNQVIPVIRLEKKAQKNEKNKKKGYAVKSSFPFF